MRINNWKKFNESNEYENPNHIRDLLLDPWIDDGLCHQSGDHNFMIFEFNNIEDFNDAKEVLEAWNMSCWSIYVKDDLFPINQISTRPTIIAWSGEIEKHILHKFRDCEIVQTNNFIFWKKDGKKIMAQALKKSSYTGKWDLHVDIEFFDYLTSQYPMTTASIRFLFRELLVLRGIIEHKPDFINRVFNWKVNAFND